MKNEELINFRKKKKLTQKKMAEKLEISFGMYQALEYGLRNPSVKVLNSFIEKFPDAKVLKFFVNKVNLK